MDDPSTGVLEAQRPARQSSDVKAEPQRLSKKAIEVLQESLSDATESAPPQVYPFYDTVDMQLLTHFMAETSTDLFDTQTYPFLMHGMLMIASMQLQLSQPDEPSYQVRTTYHVSKAAALYRHELSIGINPDNLDAIAATAILLGLHASANPLLDPAGIVEDPLLRLFAGIHSIVAKNPALETGGALVNTLSFPVVLPPARPTYGGAADLAAMIDARKPAPAAGTADSSRSDSHNNNNKSNSSDNSSPRPLSEREVYMEIIASLTILLDTAVVKDESASDPEREGLIYFFVRWLSFCRPDFGTLVARYEREALLIMLYYYVAVKFVLRKSSREWWWLKHRVEYMIPRMLAYLDREWEGWLVWPRELLEQC